MIVTETHILKVMEGDIPNVYPTSEKEGSLMKVYRGRMMNGSFIYIIEYDTGKATRLIPISSAQFEKLQNNGI